MKDYPRDFQEYQYATGQTAVYPGQASIAGAMYAALGLNGEAGEVAEQVKKAVRDDDGEISPERKENIIKELGDVLWYVSQVASECGIALEEVADRNIQKLRDRKERGVLQGTGDNR